MTSSELQVGLGINPPVVDWANEDSEPSLQKDFIFAGDLKCCLEVVHCDLSIANFSELVESIARDVYNVEGEVSISDTADEIFTKFIFDGVIHEQTHIFVEIDAKSVAHLTVFSRINALQADSLREFANSLIVKTNILPETKNLDSLTFSIA